MAEEAFSNGTVTLRVALLNAVTGLDTPLRVLRQQLSLEHTNNYLYDAANAPRRLTHVYDRYWREDVDGTEINVAAFQERFVIEGAVQLVGITHLKLLAAVHHGSRAVGDGLTGDIIQIQRTDADGPGNGIAEDDLNLHPGGMILWSAPGLGYEFGGAPVLEMVNAGGVYSDNEVSLIVAGFGEVIL